MPDTLYDLDTTWAWLYQPLQDLKSDYASEPDKSWEVRRAAFIQQLGLTDPADHPITQLLIHRLDELSQGERDALASTDDLDTLTWSMVQQLATESQPPAAPAAESYDKATWDEYLIHTGARWDGTAESWPAFRDWFRYDAAENGLGEPAAAFVGYVDGMSNEDRIATFVSYRVAITLTAGSAGDAVLDETGQAIMADLLAENPEFAEIPETDRRRVLAELLREHAQAESDQ